VKIGVISDTHDFLDPKVHDLFAGVDHILHGGDIGMPWLILELQTIAPVTAVLGNTDEPGLRYPLSAVVELETRKFLVHHIVNPLNPDDELKRRIAMERPNAVIFGHSHKPFCQEINGLLFFNPGYAGKSRFGMERSVAILHCAKERIRPEFLPL
jgi:putative phosphoesterase